MNPYEIAQACMDATAFTAPEDRAMLREKMARVINKALTKARDAALEEAARECEVMAEHSLKPERNRSGMGDVRAMVLEQARDRVRALKSPGAR